ncbi:MAG: hypothetical protein AAF693_21470 [Bacteroidota bacterium]
MENLFSKDTLSGGLPETTEQDRTNKEQERELAELKRLIGN